MMYVFINVDSTKSGEVLTSEMTTPRIYMLCQPITVHAYNFVPECTIFLKTCPDMPIIFAHEPNYLVNHQKYVSKNATSIALHCGLWVG